MKDLAQSGAQVPADVVKTAAAEIKNALDLAKSLIDTATSASATTADEVIDQVANHVDAAYQSALKLIGLAQKAS